MYIESNKAYLSFSQQIRCTAKYYADRYTDYNNLIRILKSNKYVDKNIRDYL